MRFWIVCWLVYFSALLMGLGFPLLGRLDRGRIWWLETTTDVLAFFALLLAAVTLMLMIARRFIPAQWWMAQIEHLDIYQFDGVYFIGERATRKKTRLNKLVFGVDEKLRRWDIVFGLLLIALMVPHLMGGYTAAGMYNRMIVKRPVLEETMHGTILNNLPVMRAWNRDWAAQPALARNVKRALRKARSEKKKNSEGWFKIAQLNLLSAFPLRGDPREPFRHTPGDRVGFLRSRGAEAVSYLRRILKQPQAGQQGWARGAHALIGFFHMNDRNFEQADLSFKKALTSGTDSDRTRISREHVILLAAQNALLAGDAARAEQMLEPLLASDSLTPITQALVIEHFAAALRLGGKTEMAGIQLHKALKRFEGQKNRAGIARVHLRLAALDLEQGRSTDASRNLSRAASLAHGLDDGFTLNMVEGLSQYFFQLL
ncbi:MAG: hypothetical protein O7B79_09895 [SAR324 cluster bacterium]|nr:hypothetical protein [SAR324 cluster bacterium]